MAGLETVSSRSPSLGRSPAQPERIAIATSARGSSRMRTNDPDAARPAYMASPPKNGATVSFGPEGLMKSGVAKSDLGRTGHGSQVPLADDRPARTGGVLRLPRRHRVQCRGQEVDGAPDPQHAARSQPFQRVPDAH